MQPLLPLMDVIRMHGLQPTKALGQHFLRDENLLARIVRVAGDLSGHTAVEIGPGPGGLTRALLQSAADNVVIIEKDTRCIAALEELHPHFPNRLHILHTDAMQQPIHTLSEKPISIVANLPYNVGTLLLIHWLREIYDAPGRIASLTLMFQKEVAERICAKPKSKDYGRVSVLAQWLCEAEEVFDIAPGAFYPPPSVVSSVIKLTPRAKPLPCDFDALEAVVKATFGQRRKMLRQSLKSMCDAEAMLTHATIEGTRRAEELSVEEFVRLASASRL